MAKDKSGVRQRSGKKDQDSTEVADKKDKDSTEVVDQKDKDSTEVADSGGGDEGGVSDSPTSDRTSWIANVLSALPLAVIAYVVWRSRSSLPKGATLWKPTFVQSVPVGLAPPLQDQVVAAPSYLEFGQPQSVAIGGNSEWQGRHSHGSVEVTSRGMERSIYMVHNLLHQAEVDGLLASSKVADAASSESGVSRTYFLEKGQPVQVNGVAGTLAATVQKALEERLTPYVRQQFNCPGCAVCSAFVERCPSGEKHEIQRHSDNHMFATLIAPLNPTEYTGGLYAQTAEQKGARDFIAFQPGDVVAHRHQLEKGVHVLTGTRHAAVFWFQDGERACQTEATPWYEKEAAQGDPDAQFFLGIMFLQQGDTDKGLDWLEIAAEKQQFDAVATLGAWLVEDQGMRTNLTKGLKMTQYAASFGHNVAQFNLGSLLLSGKGVSKNETMAAHWIWRAAAQGHVRASFQMGLLHKLGVGTTVDMATAARWFQVAAELGMLEAMVEVSNNYKKGLGVVADAQKGMEWLRKAAHSGSAHAKGLLGIEHLQGQNTQSNNTLAAELLEEAANEGDAASQLLIGELYAIGLGVRPSRGTARAWMKRAVAGGKEREVQEVLKGIEKDSNVPWTGLLEEDDSEDPDDILGDISDILGEDEDDILGSVEDILED